MIDTYLYIYIDIYKKYIFKSIENTSFDNICHRSISGSHQIQWVVFHAHD